MIGRFNRMSLAAAVLAAASFAVPAGTANEAPFHWAGLGWQMPLIVALVAVAAALLGLRGDRRELADAVAAIVVVAIGAALLPGLLDADSDVEMDFGAAAPALWIFLLALTVLAWRALEILAAVRSPRWIAALVVPGLFGVWLLFLWQVLVVGFDVPRVLLPSPSRIAHVFIVNIGQLWLDFRQTFLKSVLAGFALGSAAGFITAVLVDRSSFLQRGLLPLGSLVSSIPIVGIAPIMVMWFGFDWQSKAAVIVVMTFFPMLVNTLAGLQSAGDIERDLMRSYGASYVQTLAKLRLPNALPFIFNALKINSTLALIGAIVAEFFGTPVVGLGFRISVEIGRMNVDVVWAAIAVAALAGSAFYGILALLERGLTFWHPSYRQGQS
ncbi:MAG TPA: ABC transporter permease [Candidatus Sulfotelmatobacter sp.]|nr:ABC transporter permease [Candidatus Sulfotelmatobacter sp.]